ncbi:MAG TPA: M1 family metallopeptidase, partial [Anaeromyxobacteraceae bacterium]|nr:M1 family metallopeptidase [Anaeromyxobacteraceae bacterium]
MATSSLLPFLLAAAGAAAPGPDPAPPALRLPATVRPLEGALELRVDPAAPRFSGTARYRVSLQEPSSVVWMHGEGLQVESASVARRPARPVAAPGGFLGLVLDGPVPAGDAEVEVAFSGEVDRVRSRGLYAVEEGGAWYAYTFFEPVDARRAFPCFDEPWAKIPWTITLVVPAADVALANAPLARESAEGDWRRVDFAESRPLPSYLVAFVVGPFEIVPGGTGGAAKVPIRFVVPRGRSGDLRYARAVTPRILDALESTVGLPYPYEKCDVAVVPRYWGTMEHPGLVALGQPLALIPPREETRARREAYATIAIHEIAHHWYGDLVTLAWWDDVWLNESFGTWEDAHATEALEPAWKALAERRARRRDAALSADARPSARRLREPVRSSHEVEGAFDADISYYKGATVIGSFERFLGDDAWRATVREYLASRAHGSATTEDFLAVLSRRAGPEVAASFRGFLDQAGVPLVRAEVRCGGDAATVRLRQERFLADGSRDPSARWTLPLCLRWGAAGTATTTCTLVAGPDASLGLPTCPDWIWPNASGAGHWISVVPGKRPVALLPRLTSPEALALATDAALL